MYFIQDFFKEFWNTTYHFFIKILKQIKQELISNSLPTSLILQKFNNCPKNIKTQDANLAINLEISRYHYAKILNLNIHRFQKKSMPKKNSISFVFLWITKAWRIKKKIEISITGTQWAEAWMSEFDVTTTY